MGIKRGSLLLILFSALVISSGVLAQQEIKEKRGEKQNEKLNEKVLEYKTKKVKRMNSTVENDENLFSFEVDYEDKKYSNSKGYLIIYYLDGRYIKEFPSKRLPFVLERNLSGQLPGEHIIRIDIEDGTIPELFLWDERK